MFKKYLLAILLISGLLSIDYEAVFTYADETGYKIAVEIRKLTSVSPTQQWWLTE